MPIIETRNLSKSFKFGMKEKKVIDKVSLQFNKYGLYAIVGKSGCGKTTFLNLLLGLESSDNGEIYYYNQKIDQDNFDQVRKEYVSIILQDYGLIENMTAFENISVPLLIKGYSKEQIKKQYDKWIQVFNLSTIANKKVELLSGGERQRIAIIRSIIDEKKIIFADEPTGALDQNNSQELMRVLKELSKERLIIIVSHNLKLMEQYADEILEFNHFNKKKEIENYQNINTNKTKNLNATGYSFFMEKIILKRRGRIILSIFLSIVLLFLSIVSMTIYSQKENILFQISSNYLDRNMVEIKSSLKKKIPNSNYSLVYYERPYMEEIMDLLRNQDIIIHYNYQYFFNGANIVLNNENKSIVNGIQFIGISEKIIMNNKKLSYNIEAHSFDQVIVNKPFYKLITRLEDDKQINSFQLTNSILTSYPYKEEKIEDQLTYDLNLNIIAVVDEFEFLNIPVIYYPIEKLESLLSSMNLKNLSVAYNLAISWKDRLGKLAKVDEELSSYSLLIEAKSEQNLAAFYNQLNIIANNSNYEIVSRAILINQSLVTFVESLIFVLIVFIIVLFIMVVLLFGLTFFSIVIDARKDIGIIRLLGLKKNQINKLFFYSSLLFSAITISLSYCLSQVTLNYLPMFLEKLNIVKIIISNNVFDVTYQNIPLVLIVIFLGACSFLFGTAAPIYFIQKINIADELRCEI